MEHDFLKSNSDFFIEDDKLDSYSDFDSIKNPLDLIDSLTSLEQEQSDHILGLTDIKLQLKNYYNSTIDSYEQLLTKPSHATNIKDDLDHITSAFSKKLSTLDLFVIEINTSSKRTQSKLEHLRRLVTAQIANYQNLENDYRILYQQYNSNQTIEINDEVDKLMMENKIIMNKLENKIKEYDNVNKDYQEKEKEFNTLCLKFQETDNELSDKKKEIEHLKEENKQLRLNYNQMVNQVLDKITNENVNKDNNNILSNSNEHRTQSEIDIIRAIESKRMLSEKEKEICKMNYEKLLLYSFNLDKDNEYLNAKFNELNNRIQFLEKELIEVKNDFSLEKQNNIALQSQNIKLQNQVDEMQKDAEVNLVFRPSKMLEQIRLSKLSISSNVNKNNQNMNMQIINKGESFNNPFKQSKEDAPRLSNMEIGDIMQVDVRANVVKKDGTEGLSRIERENLENESVFVFQNVNADRGNTNNNLGKLLEQQETEQVQYDSKDELSKGNNNIKEDTQHTSSIIRGSMAIHNTSTNVGIEQCINSAFERENVTLFPSMQSTINNGNNNNISSPFETKEQYEQKTKSLSTSNHPNTTINIQIPSSSSTPPPDNQEPKHITFIPRTPQFDITHLRNETIDDINQVLKNKTSIISSYDFLSIRKNQTIQTLLDQLEDYSSSYEMFSDNVYVLEDKGKKSKRTLFITSRTIYIFRSDLTIKQKFPRDKLKKFTISNLNCNMIAFHFSKGDDLVIEILRRLELLYYFRDLYHFKNFGKIGFKFSNEFNIKKDGRYFTMKVNVSDSAVAQSFQNAIKLDYLYKMRSGMFSYSFVEKLVVLTNVGLLYFDDPTKPPRKLVAIVGSEIGKVEDGNNKYGKEFCFEIKTLNKEHLVFAAKSEEDLNDWINELNKMKMQYENKLNDIDT